jgi:hypothetical protein
MYKSSSKDIPWAQRWWASTQHGVLRQTKKHHLQSAPLLTFSCAFDWIHVPSVISVEVGALLVHPVLEMILKYPRKDHSSLMVGISSSDCT